VNGTTRGIRIVWDNVPSWRRWLWRASHFHQLWRIPYHQRWQWRWLELHHHIERDPVIQEGFTDSRSARQIFPALVIISAVGQDLRRTGYPDALLYVHGGPGALLDVTLALDGKTLEEGFPISFREGHSNLAFDVASALKDGILRGLGDQQWPVCPYHHHGADLSGSDDSLWWVCPKSLNPIAEVGTLSQAAG
jgi:hypothetical protein